MNRVKLLNLTVLEPIVNDMTILTASMGTFEQYRSRKRRMLYYVYIYTYTCLYIHLFIVKIYNQIEDAVHRICLLVPQDINSAQKSVFAVYCYSGVTLN